MLQQFKADIYLSLDGPAQIHDKYRKFRFNKQGSFEKILNKLKTIPYSQRKKIRIITVVTPKTCQYLSNSINFIKSLGFSNISFFPTFQYNQWKDKDISNFKIEVRNFKQNRNKIFLKDKFNNHFDTLNPKKIINISDSGVFANPYKMQNCDKLCVDFQGDFYPCERLLGFTERKKHIWKFGNVDTVVDLPKRSEMLGKIRHYIEESFPKIKSKEPHFCPFSFYFLAEQKDKRNRKEAINYCFTISEIYEKLFSEI